MSAGSNGNNVIPSGIELIPDFDAEIIKKALEIGELIANQLETFLLDLSALEHAALEKLEEYTPTDRLLTLKEAAAYLHFSPRTIDSWTKGNEPLLQFRMLGGEKRFRKIWLDNMIDNGSIKPRQVVKL